MRKKISVLLILSLLFALSVTSFATVGIEKSSKVESEQFETLHNANSNTKFIFVDSPEDIPVTKSLDSKEKVIYVIKKGQTRRTCPDCGVTALQEYEYWSPYENRSVTCKLHGWATGWDIATKYHVYDTEECFGCGFVNRVYLRTEYKVQCSDMQDTYRIRKGKSIEDGYPAHECTDGYENWPSEWDWEI